MKTTAAFESKKVLKSIGNQLGYFTDDTSKDQDENEDGEDILKRRNRPTEPQGCQSPPFLHRHRPSSVSEGFRRARRTRSISLLPQVRSLSRDGRCRGHFSALRQGSRSRTAAAYVVHVPRVPESRRDLYDGDLLRRNPRIKARIRSHLAQDSFIVVVFVRIQRFEHRSKRTVNETSTAAPAESYGPLTK